MAGKVLVSGAGVAGSCVAWWLHRYGYDVTLVEQASRPRDGGYVIDFWGLGYEVADRMGLLGGLKQSDLAVEEFRTVNARGHKVSGIDQGALQDLAGGRMMSLQRSALARELYEAVEDLATTRFGDSVTALREGVDGVDARFRSGVSEKFDLVVGADGLHSAVRRLTFGEEAGFEHFLGYFVAAFSTRGYPHLDRHVYVTYGEPGRQIWRITLDDDSTVFLLVFAADEAIDIAHLDTARSKELLARRYAGGGWETQEVLAALVATTDLYFDRVSQIEMPHWSRGRIALIGDACACPSLLAGEGSAMAMAEAYTLAGELHTANGDYSKAFAAYETRLRPYVERKQKGARNFATSFVPRTVFGLWLRNISINVAGQLGLTRLLFGAQLNEPVKLATYR